MSDRPATSLVPDSIAGVPDGLARMLIAGARRVSGLGECEALLRAHQGAASASAWACGILRSLDITLDFSSERLQVVVPAAGPVMFASNHPFGVLDALVAFSSLECVRPDIRFLGQSIAQRVPQLAQLLLPLQPTAGKPYQSGNMVSLRRALRWVRAGHALAMFPAATVSHWRWQSLRTEDPPWSSLVGIIAAAGGATVIPFHVHGRNSALFQFVSGTLPPLRHALLFRELLNKRGMHLRVDIGDAMTPQELSRFQTAEGIASAIRERVQSLGRR